jgi:murein DD-endopeptidase MepM/ murein hydrolase activator NlpD
MPAKSNCPHPKHRRSHKQHRFRRFHPTLLRTLGTAALLALPSIAVVAAEAAPVAGPVTADHSNARWYAKLQRVAAHAITDSDDSDTNFTAHRAEFLVWEQRAKFTAYVQAQVRAEQVAFYRGLQELAQRRYALPDSGTLTQGYGGRWGHPGIDIAGPYGSPVLAAANGVVAFAGQQSGYGNFIEIKESDGTYTAYGHLASIGVSVGQRVHAGQQIGQEGSTGESTGPHLHFEVRLGLNGPTEDPLAWLNAHGIQLAGRA